MLKEKKFATISSLVCMLLAIIVLVFQFLPYWTFVGDEVGEQTISISSYVWFPNSDVSNDFEDYAKTQIFPDERVTDNKMVNEIVMFPAFTFGVCALAIAACLLKCKNGIVPALATTIAGVVATLGYILSPSLGLSDSVTLHLIVCIVITVIAAVLFVANIVSWRKAVMAERARLNIVYI